MLSLALCMSLLLSAGAVPVWAETSGGISVSEVYQTSSRYDLGIAADNVRLGWKMEAESRGVLQAAYQVVVEDRDGVAWDSGWVNSDQQTGIRFPAGPGPEPSRYTPFPAQAPAVQSRSAGRN